MKRLSELGWKPLEDLPFKRIEARQATFAVPARLIRQWARQCAMDQAEVRIANSFARGCGEEMDRIRARLALCHRELAVLLEHVEDEAAIERARAAMARIEATVNAPDTYRAEQRRRAAQGGRR